MNPTDAHCSYMYVYFLCFQTHFKTSDVCACIRQPFLQNDSVRDNQINPKETDKAFFLTLRWILGRSPEFVDPKFISQGEGRECELSLVAHVYCTL